MIKQKNFMIHVRWRGAADYHVTNWGSDDREVALQRAKSIMSVIERDQVGRHAPYAGQNRFTGVKVIDQGGQIWCEERL